MEQTQIRLTLKTAIILMLIFNFFSVATAQEKALNNNQQSQDSLKYLKTKQFLDSRRTDTAVYYGEGTALIENDIGEAFITAKNRALDNLASKIKVIVRSTVEQIVTSKTIRNDGGYSEVIEESFENKTNTYTNQVLTDVSESENFIDYPEIGNVTKAVYFNKDVYNDRVSKDLEAKKNSIRTSINNGNNEFDINHHLQAVNNWLIADEKRYDFFNILPLQDNLGENDDLQNVATYINGKITYFFIGLSLEDITGKTSRYDAKGRLNKPVMIFAKYKDENEQEQPVLRLPLKVDFLQGEGNILNGITTGDYGEATLHISYINPGNRNTIIRITVDTNRISGLNKFQNLLLPAVDVSLKKTSTVALSVSFNNNGRYLSTEELENTIQSKLLKQGLAVEIVSISSADVSYSDIQRLNQRNADYLFYVYIKTISSSTVGYDNLYGAKCTGTVFVYELPKGDLIDSRQLQTFKGYGSSSEGAGWGGYNKLKKSIIDTTQIMLEKIR